MAMRKFRRSLRPRPPRLPRKKKSYGKGFGHGFSRVYRTISKYTNWPTLLGAVKDIQSMVNAEKQKVDTVILNAAAQGVTPTVAHLTAIATGDAEGSRTANSILCKYLYINGYARLNTSANYGRVRIVVVRDKQQVGDTAPVMTDVFEAASTQSFLNKATVGRFDIVFDRVLALDAKTPQRLVNKMIPLKSHARYNGTASTDIQKGGLYCFVVSDDDTNKPTLNLQARLAYYDN